MSMPDPNVHLAEAQREVHRYEARYGMALARFEAEVLTAADSFQAHEDYNDWFYCQSVLEEKQHELADRQGVRPQ